MRNALRAPGTIGLLVLCAVAVPSCADSDNPAALSGLTPSTQFEFSVSRVETFEEVEIHAHVTEGGDPLHMMSAELEIELEAGGAPRTVEMEREDDALVAHVIFYEPGEHHLHLMGTPEHHRLGIEVGELEVDVHRQHREIGPYWVELEVSPVPLLEGTSAHLHLLVFELGSEGEPGEPVAGASIGAAVHDPGGGEIDLTLVEEEAGEHEADYRFGAPGLYELHVEVEADSDHFEGEFHIAVVAEADEGPPDEGDGGGHGH